LPSVQADLAVAGFGAPAIPERSGAPAVGAPADAIALDFTERR